MIAQIDIWRRYTPEELTSQCSVGGAVLKQGTLLPPVVSHGVCQGCIPKFMQGVTITIIDPEEVAVNG